MELNAIPSAWNSVRSIDRAYLPPRIDLPQPVPRTLHAIKFYIASALDGSDEVVDRAAASSPLVLARGSGSHFGEQS